MRKTVVVRDRQTIFDIAIQVYGSIEGVFDLIKDNPTKLSSVTDVIPAGTLLETNRAFREADTVNYYVTNKLLPANGEPPAVVLPPIDIDNGDFNNDYNIDYTISNLSL